MPMTQSTKVENACIVRNSLKALNHLISMLRTRTLKNYTLVVSVMRHLSQEVIEIVTIEGSI